MDLPQAPILVFDIETIPDLPLLFENYGEEVVWEETFSTSLHWKSFSAYKAFQEQTKIKFPQTLYHCLLSVCAVFVDPQTYRIMDGFKKTICPVSSYAEFRAQEKIILQDFWEFSLKYQDFHDSWYDFHAHSSNLSHYQKQKLKKLPVTFCGYNIASFDLMVIEQRSLINFIQCPINNYARNLGTDSYRYKYASDKVFDLMHFVCNYDNKNARVGLDVLARSLGLGGKMKGMDGSEVAEQYFTYSAWQKIEEYCAIDVLITYGVLLSVQRFRGLLNLKQFQECVAWFEQWLLKEGRPLSYHELARSSQEFFRRVESE